MEVMCKLPLHRLSFICVFFVILGWVDNRDFGSLLDLKMFVIFIVSIPNFLRFTLNLSMETFVTLMNIHNFVLCKIKRLWQPQLKMVSENLTVHTKMVQVLLSNLKYL
jgi:hypothetical protein